MRAVQYRRRAIGGGMMWHSKHKHRSSFRQNLGGHTQTLARDERGCALETQQTFKFILPRHDLERILRLHNDDPPNAKKSSILTLPH
jgi:hypothetical protein